MSSHRAQTVAADDVYIWIVRWGDFQTYQTKRGKQWSPPWIKNHVGQLADDRYLDLSDRQRALLHDLRMVFAMTRGRLRRDAPTIARYRHRQTRDEDLEALNRAGLIEFCSGTVLEQKWDAFWNGSNPEVDKTRKEPRAVTSTTDVEPSGNGSTVDRPWENELDLTNLLHDMPAT